MCKAMQEAIMSQPQEEIVMENITQEVSQTQEEVKQEEIDIDENQYFAGLIDAQLSVTLAKNKSVRVTLTSHDARIADELSAKFRPTRVTIVKRPAKKDLCTILFTNEQAEMLLKFAADYCIMKKDLAMKTLKYMKEQTGDITTATVNENLDDISVDWASGFFDVRGIVSQPVPATETTKKKRGNVKVVLPKAEKFVIPALQKVLHGKVKKSSPCRLVFETKDSLKDLLTTVNGHVRAKKQDLMTVL